MQHPAEPCTDAVTNASKSTAARQSRLGLARSVRFGRMLLAHTQVSPKVAATHLAM